MEAEINMLEGITTVGKSDSNHWVTMDGLKDFNGAEGANKPMELVLIALGGCTVMDVISILSKMHQPFTGVGAKLSADVSEEHPKVFERIKIKYIVDGKVEPEKLERAIKLSRDRYCPVSSMLRKACPIEWEYEIR
ncbi:MAG: OsmC family protein [Candidatus Thermoplasmatota archaeon]|jgi:putative redox protein|nr:OsmC family protein [Candidatus Thermoplasmatota archaeon]MDP7264418.1 OsmC family protein [Candidatus Thermoplasmatota archaeon]MDP7422583.1 OsmC family protein [bacterium]